MPIDIQWVMAWIEKDNALHLEIKTQDFAEALALVNAVGEVAGSANHHPDIEFGWGYLRIHLTSHDQGCVTERDKKLAGKIDVILPK
jgi:4a-hydroxytetrahydrobiopterin dehydratase